MAHAREVCTAILYTQVNGQACPRTYSRKGAASSSGGLDKGMDVLQRAGDDLAAHVRGLVVAVLGNDSPTDADMLVADAEALGVDPLDFCIYRRGMPEALVLSRAAQWAGLTFVETVPRLARGSARLSRMDHLATIRTMRAELMGRDVTFCAPRTPELVRLAIAATQSPDLARRVCIVPARAIRRALAAASSEDLTMEARHRLTRRWPFASANVDLTIGARVAFVALFLLVTGLAVAAPMIQNPLLLGLFAILFVAPAVLRFAAIVIPPAPARQVRRIPDRELPVYTVLLPLRDEAEMVPQLSRAMRALDYPADRLDIKFVVEEKSLATVAAVQAVLDDPRFEMVTVPDAAPRTKPKALNYALPLCRGELLVVYDAEDIPDPRQLRLAASRFAAEPGLDCLQAELVIDNAAENPLTALFAAEYAGQFGLMLPLLGRFRLPMPLGGTSNHFRIASLRELGHWDAYNVTEDADLGVRLSRLRYSAETLESETGEEAPITLPGWIVQRTRWIKGWMQTFIVHNRSPRRFLADIGWRNFAFFQIYVGSLILSALLHTFFLVGFLLRGLLGKWPNLTDPMDATYLAVLTIGYGGAVALPLAGLARRRAWHLLPAQLLLPLYWVLHSVAAVRATYELIVRPFFWGQTVHGRTRWVRGTAGRGFNAAGAPRTDPRSRSRAAVRK